MMSLLGLVLGCTAPTAAPQPPPVVFLQRDVPDIGIAVPLPEIGARVTVLEMTTSTLGGGGHRAHAVVRLGWDDGASETHEGDLGLVFRSRNYEFWIDGIQDMASVDVRGPLPPPDPALEPHPEAQRGAPDLRPTRP